jgi:NAD(P)-dependent dehydrogenase (short-subunit alcohol dehydrogenase family)
VTWGRSGIGHNTARGLGPRGASVLASPDGGRNRSQRICDEHPGITVCVADVARPDDAARTNALASDARGRLDGLVNLAGAGAILPLQQVTAERIDASLAVGPGPRAAPALPHLIATRGAIITVSSTFGRKPATSLSHHAASRAALEHLARC